MQNDEFSWRFPQSKFVNHFRVNANSNTFKRWRWHGGGGGEKVHRSITWSKCIYRVNNLVESMRFGSTQYGSIRCCCLNFDLGPSLSSSKNKVYKIEEYGLRVQLPFRRRWLNATFECKGKNTAHKTVDRPAGRTRLQSIQLPFQDEHPKSETGLGVLIFRELSYPNSSYPKKLCTCRLAFFSFFVAQCKPFTNIKMWHRTLVLYQACQGTGW